MSLRRALPVARMAYASRAFATTSTAHKTLTDSMKETADVVNKRVGQTLASGLGKVAEATVDAQDTITNAIPSKLTTHAAAEYAQQSVKSAGQKTNEALDEAAGKARRAKADIERNLEAKADTERNLERDRQNGV